MWKDLSWGISGTISKFFIYRKFNFKSIELYSEKESVLIREIDLLRQSYIDFFLEKQEGIFRGENQNLIMMINSKRTRL